MENVQQKIDALLKDWESSMPKYHDSFIGDGIINEDEYQKASPKILFIMKEPNDKSQTKWSFQELWNDKLKGHFTYRIAEWSYGCCIL